MTDPTTPQPTPPPIASASEFIVTFALVLAAIALLLLFDTGLARVDSEATKVHATREYRIGENLFAQGKVPQAIDHFRTAASLDRENSAYTVALSEAILAEGRPAEAAPLLTPLLDRDATDGAANLAMARALAKEGRVDEAKAYYHRAIYGLWAADAERHRATARFELIDLLAKTDAKQELLAELLPLQDEAASDTALRKRIGHLFVQAGSPLRGSEIFRDVLRKNPRDADAYIGLAEAAFALGDFPAAHTDLVAAQKLMPEDSAVIQARIQVADSAMAIDPTQRGLGLEEQFRRSRNLVQMTITSAHKCLDAEAPQVAAALDSVARILVAPSAAASRRQTIEENLSLAGALWRMRAGRCLVTGSSEAEALALVQNRIAQ
ncbi:MAG: tetratricopeptide repeat protein [Gemmatimonadaceae bacterium]